MEGENTLDSEKASAEEPKSEEKQEENKVEKKPGEIAPKSREANTAPPVKTTIHNREGSGGSTESTEGAEGGRRFTVKALDLGTSSSVHRLISR